MFAAPITGYVLMNIEGKEVLFFGVELVNIVESNGDFEKLAHNFHGIAGDLLLYTFVLHFIAALYHQYIRRDETLTRIKFNN